MSLIKRFQLDCLILSAVGLLLAVPVVSHADSFSGFKVISESPVEVVVEIQSNYSGSHGPKAHVYVMPTIEDQDSSDFGYSTKNCNKSNDIKVGVSATCVTISRIRGIGEIITDGLQACMFDAVSRNYIYCESFAYVKEWDGLASDVWSPTRDSNLSDLAFSMLKMEPEPEMDDGERVKLNMSRLYKVKATIVNKGGTGASEFIVRTVCHRGGDNIYSMGEQSVSGLLAGSSFDVSYNIDPSKVGGGGCLLRTLVDADDQVVESDESESGNTWESMAVVLP
jgi:hypothetical protein